MTLLEGPPVIAEDLLEGVFVDPLPCGCHSAGLYHVLAPRSTRLCTPLRPPLPIVSPCRDGQKGGSSKRKFLYARDRWFPHCWGTETAELRTQTPRVES